MGLEKRCRFIFGSVLAVTVVVVIYFGYYRCSGISQFECFPFNASPSPYLKQRLNQTDNTGVTGSRTYTERKLSDTSSSTGVEADMGDIKFEEDDLYREYDLDLEDVDVIVFVHIQKTGGTTFGRHLVKNLDVEPPCKCYHGRKKCDCYTKGRKIWLFSRFSTGWVCGLHADWTELTSCVGSVLDRLEKNHRKRKYHFITLLRQPVYRYISEWKHVQRGATWKSARLQCNGRKATLREVPFCYKGEDWSSVELDDFMACPHNLANNRQTRMLANLSLVNCYNHSTIPEQTYKKILLESAKENLKNMAFIGLLEYQNYTQRLFEHTFNLNFIDDFEQYDKTHSGKATKFISEEQFKKIKELNDLDVKLYQFAKELFFQRLGVMEAEKGGSNATVADLLRQAEEDSVEYYDDYTEEGDEEEEEEDEYTVAKNTNELKSFLRDMNGS